MTFFFFIFSLSILLGGCLAEERKTPLPASELAVYQNCSTDDDCIAVHNGCCPECPTKKDEEIVWIHKQTRKNFEALFSKNCICPQCIKILPQRNWKPVCLNMKCTARPAE